MANFLSEMKMKAKASFPASFQNLISREEAREGDFYSVSRNDRWQKRLIGLFLLLIMVASCREKDPTSTESSFPAPTPFKLSVPYYFEAEVRIPASNPMTVEGIALGKALFFEKELSEDKSVSCASCHNPDHGFSDQRPLAVGIYNQTGRRNTIGLLNVGFQQKYFWDGRDTSLEQQSLHPIQDATEMNLSLPEAIERLKKSPVYPNLFGRAFGSSEITSVRMAKALAQFERSLTSFKSKYDRYLMEQYIPTEEEKLGMQLFFKHPVPGEFRGGNCGDCHFHETLMGNQTGFSGFHNTGLTELNASDNGLQKITGNAFDFGKFKTPPLRNVALTAPYMHDGRFQTLEDVLDHYNSDQIFGKPNVDILIKKGANEKFSAQLGLTDPEKKAIVAFLHMLTDSTGFKP